MAVNVSQEAALELKRAHSESNLTEDTFVRVGVLAGDREFSPVLRSSVSNPLAKFPPSDHPEMSVDRDEQALVLVRVVDEEHREAVLELDLDVAIVDDVAAAGGGVHDVEEARIGPPTFTPLSDDLAAAKETHWRLRDEVDRAERELEIELSNSNLRSELSDNRRQVEVAGYPVHVAPVRSYLAYTASAARTRSFMERPPVHRF